MRSRIVGAAVVVALALGVPATAQAGLLGGVFKAVNTAAVTVSDTAGLCTHEWVGSGAAVSKYTRCEVPGGPVGLVCDGESHSHWSGTFGQTECRVQTSPGTAVARCFDAGSSSAWTSGQDAMCAIAFGALGLTCEDRTYTQSYPPSSTTTRRCTLSTGSGAPVVVPLTALP